MTFGIIAKTGVQQQIKIPISGRVVIQPNTWYTCPAGKRAICKGTVLCDSRGAAATATFQAAGISIFRWDRSALFSPLAYIDTPSSLSDGSGGQTALFEIELAAGEIIQTIQNVGTNAAFELLMEVLELPV